VITYAQYLEDVVIRRALLDVDKGFYIDVGAYHPEHFSVTKHFYDAGWSGINIEPVPAFHERFTRERPRDINLNIALGSQPGTAVMYELSGENGALSTLRPEISDEHLRNISGSSAASYPVKVLRLDEVIRDHAGDRPIHFLKVDTEGTEHDVLRGMNFRLYRPWLIAMESTIPTTEILSHAEWEPLLLEAGYTFAMQFRINRFYVAQEHPEVLARLAIPIDAYRTAHEIALEATVAAIQAGNVEFARQLAEIHSSMFWKISSPFRALAQLSFGGRRR
jgi:FkbM family methyltransferase